MAVTGISMINFRCFTDSTFSPDPTGLTVLQGPNGSGKTSVIEAVAWLATMKSFRGAPREALPTTGEQSAFIRAEIDHIGRNVLAEAEIPVAGTARIAANRQPVRKRADLAELLQVTVFSPDDLRLVQGGPAGRRDLLDEVIMSRTAKGEALVTETERALRQRAALLRQAGGRITSDVEATLDVWDERLASAGTALAEARELVVEEISPKVAAAYVHLAGRPECLALTYHRSWTGDLIDALRHGRTDDLRRQSTGTGPHRDELEISISSRSGRTHASQGEQRCLALSLRLAIHQVATQRSESPPVLLLDDVFSELDAFRSSALLEALPVGQVILSTAGEPPAGVDPRRVVYVTAGVLLPEGAR